MGLMAFYLPTLDVFDKDVMGSEDETQRIYADLIEDLSAGDRMFLLSNDSDCVNYVDIKAKYEVRQQDVMMVTRWYVQSMVHALCVSRSHQT